MSRVVVVICVLVLAACGERDTRADRNDGARAAEHLRDVETHALDEVARLRGLQPSVHALPPRVFESGGMRFTVDDPDASGVTRIVADGGPTWSGVVDDRRHLGPNVLPAGGALFVVTRDGEVVHIGARGVVTVGPGWAVAATDAWLAIGGDDVSNADIVVHPLSGTGTTATLGRGHLLFVDDARACWTQDVPGVSALDFLCRDLAARAPAETISHAWTYDVTPRRAAARPGEAWFVLLHGVMRWTPGAGPVSFDVAGARDVTLVDGRAFVLGTHGVLRVAPDGRLDVVLSTRTEIDDVRYDTHSVWAHTSIGDVYRVPL